MKIHQIKIKETNKEFQLRKWRKDEEDTKKFTTKDCGKHAGYCDGLTVDGYKCGLMFGHLEIGFPCGRCGNILKENKINYG